MKWGNGKYKAVVGMLFLAIGSAAQPALAAGYASGSVTVPDPAGGWLSDAGDSSGVGNETVTFNIGLTGIYASSDGGIQTGSASAHSWAGPGAVGASIDGTATVSLNPSNCGGPVGCVWASGVRADASAVWQERVYTYSPERVTVDVSLPVTGWSSYSSENVPNTQDGTSRFSLRVDGPGLGYVMPDVSGGQGLVSAVGSFDIPAGNSYFDLTMIAYVAGGAGPTIGCVLYSDCTVFASQSLTLDYSHTFRWGGVISALNGSGSSIYDEISLVGESGLDYKTYVNSVPEPETYALLLAGLGVLGWVGRRRKAS